MPETTLAATSFTDKLDAARTAARTLASATTLVKNAALSAIAEQLRANAPRIQNANDLDLANGRENGLAAGLLDRLTLDATRIDALAAATLELVGLVDPVGETVRGRSLPNGVRIEQVRVPFGVVGAIYEARPNVTVDIAALAIKSGNAVVLRGGSAAENTNRVLVELLQDALESVGLPRACAQTIDEFGR
jgi:glutamate-5-semialdehyde dehydrogenase